MHTPAYSVDTLGLPPRDSRISDPAADRARAIAHEVLVRNIPGYPTDDRYRQSRAYTGVKHMCIRALQDAMASVTIRVQTKKGKGEAPNLVKKAMPTPRGVTDDQDYEPVSDRHPLVQLFRRPNGVQTFGRWIAGWVLQKQLVGEHYIWPVMGQGTDYPVELWNITPALTNPLPVSPRYPCGGIRVMNWSPNVMGPTGTQFELDARDIIRDWDEHPLFPWSAHSRLTAGAIQLDVLDAIEEAWKNHVVNGWAPEAVINVKGAGHDELKRMAADMKAQMHGSQGRRTLYTDGESLDVKMLSSGAREMDYGAGWDRMVKIACGIFQTPASVVGTESPGSYAAYYAQLKQYHTQALRPMAKDMGDMLTLHLADRYWPDEEMCVVLDLPAIDDREMLNAEVKTRADTSSITVNQIIGLYGGEPVGPEGDVPPKVYETTMLGKVTQQQQQQAIAAGTAPDPTKPSPDTMLGGAGGPPKGADNPDGEGSLPPKMLAKSMRQYARRRLKSLGRG